MLSRFPQTLPVNAASCALVKTRGSRLWPQPRSLRCALPCQHALPVAFVLLSSLAQVCQLYDTIPARVRPSNPPPPVSDTFETTRVSYYLHYLSE